MYYLLFVLLFMGAFAAMAQNNYGLTILALVATGFAAVFIYLLFERKTKKKTAWQRAELILLDLLAALIAARIFTVQGAISDGLFLISIGGLVLLYGGHILSRKAGARTPLPVTLFYIIAILFLLSLFFTGFRPGFTGLFGILAMGLIFLWIFLAWFSRKRLVAGEPLTMMAQVARSGSQVMVVVFFFLLSGLYLLFARTGIIPKIYSDRQPRAYFDLVNDAEAGRDKPVEGKYKYQRFKDSLEQFLEDSRKREH